MKRVVITGMGSVSPFGLGTEKLWSSLLEGKNGIAKISHLPIEGEIINIAASLPNLSEEIDRTPQLVHIKTEDRSTKTFFLAALEAVEQSGLDFSTGEHSDTACMVADRPYSPTSDIEHYLPALAVAESTGTLCLNTYVQELRRTRSLDHRRSIDHFDSINHFIASYFGLSGPSLSIGTACASGNNSIGEAFEKIRRGRVHRALAGGAYNFDLNAMIGFTRIGALTPNPDPDTACRPFDAARNGFVMGSGCGVLVMEELEEAKKRGAEILCEVTGYASYADGFRATDPDPEAKGACRTIAEALRCARLTPDDINYINAHGTSTKMNDRSETLAIKSIFGDRAYCLPISSTKSMIGHGIMAAGALEAIACINSIRSGVIHGTRNYKEQEPELNLDYVGDGARAVRVKHCLSNNFGFGGQNASVVFSRF